MEYISVIVDLFAGNMELARCPEKLSLQCQQNLGSALLITNQMPKSMEFVVDLSISWKMT
jgi:hypothetical protein